MNSVSSFYRIDINKCVASVVMCINICVIEKEVPQSKYKASDKLE